MDVTLDGEGIEFGSLNKALGISSIIICFEKSTES